MGILSAGDNSAAADGGLTHGPLFKNSLEFTLTAAAGFSLSQLGNSVVFQYGTALDEPSFPGTPPDDPVGGGLQAPEPASVVVWLMLSCVMGLVATGQRTGREV